MLPYLDCMEKFRDAENGNCAHPNNNFLESSGFGRSLFIREVLMERHHLDFQQCVAVLNLIYTRRAYENDPGIGWAVERRIWYAFPMLSPREPRCLEGKV